MIARSGSCRVKGVARHTWSRPGSRDAAQGGVQGGRRGGGAEGADGSESGGDGDVIRHGDLS